ncbi:PTS N-acetylgalactosamine transporter subunit IIA [Streptococcus sp. zg-86]|uniref:PTS N-acetylgalactosamine transporter subunit IIA n=1 Tax=Streptococcus zhangguiae TaxID=2664091 RepID=A0A6I4RCJ7_9STRE|nr:MULTISPECIES: PTS sugar transporter subunit IIA [unclassified Streptococcus]MTB63532.1 PTS N-acetylgalactosamine transporter subunit IIA [Streptococcus sp. zg-86]MTB89819.1 PTS N-acetylgalactosamine transporter subunit IIA [Streptococcus sp. zg-36]MWV55490.1 PTS N-acetylgalactosamine transporter subunit IIA [Streptococcus sp. zg-70]QTH48782.1 PTS sugar transporter subunit IIA [Streptococcus sp. zg-86]
MNLVLVAHGHFASGIKSSLELIAGPQENLHIIDFVADMSADQVKDHLLESITETSQTLILCDLLGGTPFKVASTLMLEQQSKNICVLSGLNLSMLLEVAFSRIECSLEEVVERAISSGQTGIVDARQLFRNCQADDTVDDGI